MIFDAVLYDHAGDLIMRECARKASEQTGIAIALHRNNVDGKGASWGTHENYMMLRSVPFDQVAKLMTAHFVARQIFTGAGRVVSANEAKPPDTSSASAPTIFI